MNATALLALLQAAATLLTLAQGPHATAASMQNAITTGSQTVQVVTQATAKIPFTVTPDDSIWPNVKDLLQSPYLDANGNYVPVGSTVAILQQYAAFGDLNNDDLDDATVVVNKPSASGTANYFLAALVNQNGILFNIADAPLGSSVDSNATHTISSGVITFGAQQYQLLGNQLIKE